VAKKPAPSVASQGERPREAYGSSKMKPGVSSPWIEKSMPSVKKDRARNMIRVSRIVRADRIRMRQANAESREAAETIQKWNVKCAHILSEPGSNMRTPRTISGTARATAAIRDGMSSLPLRLDSRRYRRYGVVNVTGRCSKPRFPALEPAQVDIQRGNEFTG
jgi:hypothetical protein